jgi:lambda repressor-like predicted transcriptional regulator
MENKDRISGSLEEVNGFQYLKKGKEKYFVGDFVEIYDTELSPNGKPYKFEITDFLKTPDGFLVGTSNSNYGSNLFSGDRVKCFYYKKDIKKYVHKGTLRIFEAKEDELVADSLGNKGYLKDMILVNKKLVVKSICTKIRRGNNESDYYWVLISELGRISHFKCAYDGELYHYDYRAEAYIAKKVSDTNFQVDRVLINRGIKDKIITCNIKILNPNYSSEVCTLLNGEELLKEYPDKFAIGPRSGQLILKSKIKSDGYRQYDNGYYFPEFKSLQKFKPGNNEHNFKWGLDSPTHLVTEGLKYTFGVEIEMADCTFTPNMMRDYNIMVEKDGSIRNSRGEKYGPEIITGVLKGDHGFAHLQALCNELANKGEVNHTCGIHAHVGSADFNNTNIVLLFKLLKHLEEEVFNMLPRSRRDNEYCRKLPNLDFNFDGCNTIMDMKIRVDNYYTELFTKAANSPPSDKLNKMVNHPKGAKVGYDHSNIRYCWTNFIPALFNTRNTKPPTYTIEFRCFNASTNFTKIKNWVKICMGLVNFAENHHSDIMSNTVTLQGQVLPLTLKNVMNKVYPKSYRILNDFIDMRTELFKNVELEDTKNENEVSTNLKLKELI